MGHFRSREPPHRPRGVAAHRQGCSHRIGVSFVRSRSASDVSMARAISLCGNKRREKRKNTGEIPASLESLSHLTQRDSAFLEEFEVKTHAHKLSVLSREGNRVDIAARSQGARAGASAEHSKRRKLEEVLRLCPQRRDVGGAVQLLRATKNEKRTRASLSLSL
jgi:hypothetical protein